MLSSEVMATPPFGDVTKQGASAAPAPVAHSLVEERLFLLTVRCPCGGGPYEKVAQALANDEERRIDVVRARCPRCAAEREFRFDVTSFIGRFYPRRGVSDTDEPSRLLDAVAWARWARTYLRAFEGERSGLEGADKVDCGVLALRCLDEALKQFRRGETALVEADLFTPGSMEAFRAGPDRYNRYDLMGLKLQAAMLLAALGVDPDARDPGTTHGAVARSQGALSTAPPRGESGEMHGGFPPPPRPAALGALPPASKPRGGSPERRGPVASFLDAADGISPRSAPAIMRALLLIVLLGLVGRLVGWALDALNLIP